MHFGISECVDHWACYRPNLVAVYHNRTLTSYSDLNTRINKICENINKIGFTSNRIAVAVESTIDALCAYIAVIRMGKSIVLLNTGLPDSTIRVNIKDSGSSFLIHDNKFAKYQSLFRKGVVLKVINLSEVLFSSIDNSTQRITSLSKPVDEWGIFFSSGTTGIPKGIERNHSSIVTELLGWVIELSLTRKTCFYIGRPIYYTGGLVLSLSTLIVGGSIVLNDYPDNNDYKSIWIDYQKFCSKIAPEWAFFVPGQLRNFMELIIKEDYTPNGAEKILVMGANISRQEKLDASKLMKSYIVESWGNSESLGTITDIEDLSIRPDSIGRPFLTDELFIVGEEGEIFAPYEVGNIAGSEEAGFEKYSNRPDETNRVKKNKLIISDDLGYMDKDGYFYVCGRKQETIILEGYTLYLSDIEKQVRALDFVRECCVLAEEANKKTANLICLVELIDDEHCQHTDLLQVINATLTKHHKLYSVHKVKSLPCNPSGKIDKHKCKQLLDQKRCVNGKSDTSSKL